MSVHRRAAKRDKNEREIIDVLEISGYMVVPVSGEGVPDLLVASDKGKHPINVLMEIKGKRGKLTKAQVKFHAEWKGQCAVIRTAEDALELMRILEGLT